MTSLCDITKGKSGLNSKSQLREEKTNFNNFITPIKSHREKRENEKPPPKKICSAQFSCVKGRMCQFYFSHKQSKQTKKMCGLTSQWKDTKIGYGHLRGPDSVGGIHTLLPSCCCSCSYQTPRQSEGKLNMCHTRSHIFNSTTNSHFSRLTSKIFFSLVDDLIDMDAEMMEFSCYRRWSKAQNQQR